MLIQQVKTSKQQTGSSFTLFCWNCGHCSPNNASQQR